jgi:hypothetical protein
LLVQDWDLDDDGEPETLRLLFATPRRWLEDGKTIDCGPMPTAFGNVGVRAASSLQAGRVVMTVSLPERNPIHRIYLRARVPDGWRVTQAEVGETRLSVDERGTVDLSGQRGEIKVVFAVTKR